MRRTRREEEDRGNGGKGVVDCTVMQRQRLTRLVKRVGKGTWGNAHEKPRSGTRGRPCHNAYVKHPR
eukprot:4422803-Pyramimonas_sp.AAC.1